MTGNRITILIIIIIIIIVVMRVSMALAAVVTRRHGHYARMAVGLVLYRCVVSDL